MVGRYSTGLVQPNDVAAKVLSFSGFTDNELSQMMPHSNNLAAVISGRISPRDVAVCEYRNSGYGTGGRYYDPEVHCTMVFDGRYKLSAYHEPDAKTTQEIGELYDMEEDPGETDNLWWRPEYTEIRLRLLLRLIDWKTDVENTYVGGRGGEVAPWHNVTDTRSE